MDSLIALVPRFAAATAVTLEVSVLAALIGMVAGFALNALRLAFGRAFALPYGAFIWLIRGTPYLSQLVIVYFGLPMIGVTMSAVEATVVSLALYASAYFAEIFRTAWASVPRGQLEAAAAFGVSRRATFRAIELPQALAFALPLIANQTILVIKESAVASIITVPELTMTASDVVASTYTYIGPYALLIACYWLLTQAVSLLAQRATARIPLLRKTS
ncbi:amino acid ABC transporter permease [Paraburkholderia tropica]|uniref:Amino acid ABC transporter membrane protein 2, PAAT family n=1 Tax=Paraburkholderia tropica TaxID=92647 RepID=A0AAQ1GIZ2_9BURK|nr:amino acid ABC transporter permease [Paraburkholderia tropica]RQN37423.1 amino acid ABC transporter permease [Paraburkholderia tropica]SEK02010.1 amino acid ABC transporter membrane protein 2, PAAT family [Paraburkholderia tropica]